MQNKIPTPHNNESMSHKLADALHDRLDSAADAGAKMEHNIHDKSAQAQQKARKVGAEVSDAAGQINNEFTNLAKNNPWAVAGGALALGFLIGALSRNR